jgi:hypothetical protein
MNLRAISVHDKEPGIITIKKRHTLWNARIQGTDSKAFSKIKF